MVERDGSMTNETGAEVSDPRQLTAFHEAGHAVIALAVGRPLQKVTIAANRDRLGLCHLQKGRSRASKDWLEDEILILLAGMAAESQLSGKYNLGGAEQDLKMARRLAIMRAGNAQQAERLERRLLTKTEHLLADEGHWNAVQHIANDLLERETISGRAALHWFNQAVAKADK
jgi:ATP-dependent Zn protease